MANFTKEESKREIAKLVEDFDNKINIIKKGDGYKEANVEDEFIKPLFKYLNWNISNEGIKNIADREFIVQAKGKGGKEPDYLLQLEGKPFFYIEAKHPKYDLFKEIKYIWQAYSYAYSTQSSSERKKVDFSLLTDFEEFRLFDCTFKTDPHTVNNFNVVDWKYTDYVDKFDLLWQYFEKENVREGSLKSLYINEKQIKENRIPPNKAFLDDLDNEKTGWRIILAKDIKKYNPELSSDFITSVIQLIIDRFVFIKVLSDREIEDDFLAQVIEQINKASLKSDEGTINDTCKDLFTKMNKTYNGSIFEERKELDIVKLSNKTLHSILKTLLPENSRYNFKVIPVAILGTIYEQFLGKIVTTTDKRATIEYKPEVRKAGGVYYTPQYIVECIVENTVGTKLSKCKSINNLMSIKICDPACGSGSFLLEAYDKLITWTIQYYFNKQKSGKDLTRKERELFYQDNDGNIRLTAKIKRNILNNCIFGVDIDPQAVEVTKMSLSLKALEDTKHDELYNEVNLFNEKVLPDLTDNIKCGNSLIGSDFYKDKNFSLFANDEMRKINVFDWEKEFPEIFKNGGFDCVIGNPPYVTLTLGKKQDFFSNEEINYFKIKYSDIFEYKNNTYNLFIKKAISLLKDKGLHSFIIPSTLLLNDTSTRIRKYILENTNVIFLIWLKYKVFQNAEIGGNLIYVYEKNKHNPEYEVKASKVNEIESFSNKKIEIIKQKKFNNTGFKFYLSNFKLDFLNKVCNDSTCTLETFIDFYQGIITGDNKKYLSNKKEGDDWLPILRGENIFRYYTDKPKFYVFFKPEKLWSNTNAENFYKNEKLINRQTSDKLIVAYDNEKYLSLDSTHVQFIKDINMLYNLKYFVALENSKLFNKIYSFFVEEEGRTFAQVKTVTLKKLPIRKIEFSNVDEKFQHDSLVSLVDQMLDAQKEYQAKKDTTDEHACKIMKQRIDNIDNQIDELVYKLYNLTEDEIKIVEEA